MRNTLAALLIAAWVQPVLAQDWPDLVGSWQGTSRAIVTAAEHHYGEETIDGTDGLDEGAFASSELTVEITEQSDGRYIGSITSAGHTEPKYMIVASDGVTLRASDVNGLSTGRIIDVDSFELCYAQFNPSTVSCVVFTRASGD